MSSIFELHDRIRRLRETLSNLKETNVAHSAELREAVAAGGDERAREEWSKYLFDLRECLSAAESLTLPPNAPRRRKPSRGKALPRRVGPSLEAKATLH